MSDRAWVPWRALVLLIVAALVVAGVAVARPSWFGFGDDSDVPPDRRLDTSLLDLGDEDGLRLNDDNATSQAFEIPVPVDSRIEDPVLRLRGTTEAAESSTVFLRVLADGTAAYVAQLPSGRHALSADIELPKSVIEDGVVRVQVRTTGSLGQRRCNLTDELGTLVVLDPARTEIRGRLDEALHTVRDVAAGLNHRVSLVLAAPDVDEAWFWRVPYALADLPGGTLPRALQLRMLIPATTDDSRWIVEVRLNDELVDSPAVPGVGPQDPTVPCPPARS